MIETGKSSLPKHAGQPMLPGMDALTNAVAKLHRNSYTQEAHAIDQGLKDARIVPIQAAVAERFEEEVIRPREQIWHDTVTTLSAIEPSKVACKGDTPPQADCIWYFDKTITTDGAEAVVKIGYYADNVKLGNRAKPTQPNELDTAARVLSTSDMWNNPPPKWERPEKTLLGVPVKSDHGEMTVERGPLASEVAKQTLAKTDTLRLTVSADIMNGEGQKTIYEATVARDDFAPLGENRGRGDKYLTDVRHLRRNYLYMYEGLGGDEDALPQKAEEYLERTYIEPGIGIEYEQFAAALQHIDTATPQVNDQRDVVLKRKSWIRRKLTE